MRRFSVSMLLLLLGFCFMYVYGEKMYIERNILPEYYGYSYDVNWDGHDAYLYSYISDFDTSTSYPIMIGTDYDGYNEWSRGHIQYDLSSIPSDATILSAGLQFYVAFVDQWSDKWDSHHDVRVKIYSMERNQAGYSPHNGDIYTYDLYDDADNGTLYETTGSITMDTQFDEYFPSDTSYFNLGSVCVDSIQNRVSSGVNWVGFGLTHYNPDDNLDQGIDLFGKLTKLHIVYQPADVPLLLNPSVSPDSGDTNTYFKYSVDYIDSAGYAPDTALCIVDDTLKIPLLLTSGIATNGNYSTKITLNDTGWHNYYYRFVNDYGNIVIYPANAPNTKIDGPFVGYGLGIKEKNERTIQYTWQVRKNRLLINSKLEINGVDIYSLNGAKLFHGKYNKNNVNIPLNGLIRKLTLCKITFGNGEYKFIKFIDIK